MAKRKSKRSHSKIQPSVLTFGLSETLPAATQPGGPGTPVIGTSTTKYIDLSQVASVVNRRFYRQGLNWAVAGMKFLQSDSSTTDPQTPSGFINVQKLPNTWVMNNAWTKAFRNWEDMNDKAQDGDERVEGRFLDFKIYADSGHLQAGYISNWRPAGYTPGEWIPSEIRVPQSTGGSIPFEFIAVGDNYPGPGFSGKDAVSLVQGYANSRSLPAVSDPNNPTDLVDGVGATPENWIASLTNEGTSQDANVIADIVAYDQPPYPYENDGIHVTTMYPGGAVQSPILQVHDQALVTGTTIGGTTRIKGGNFPCGLIKVDVVNYALAQLDLILLIDMVPGNHRGYLAESMLEA